MGIERLVALTFAAAAALSPAGPAQAVVRYVDDGAAPGGNGLGWPTAYNNLQSALTAALSGDEIRVAQGTYFPSAQTIPGNPRSVSFSLKNGVQVKGGFAGPGAADPDARDVDAYPTILSGDIGVPGDPADNAHRVVRSSANLATAVLDGFTITLGRAAGPQALGAALYVVNGNPTVRECTMVDNVAESAGGAVYAENGPATFESCAFLGNSAPFGGGILTAFCNGMVVSGCHFQGNVATRGGGGVRLGGGTTTISGCTFTGNASPGGPEEGTGGALELDVAAAGTVSDCTFTDNTAQIGGAIFVDGSSPAFECCLFTGSTASLHAGAVSVESLSDVTFTACTFQDNGSVGRAGAFHLTSQSEALLIACDFNGNASGELGGAFNLGSNSVATLEDCTFTSNESLGPGSNAGGALHNEGNAMVFMTGCVFFDNFADGNAGAARMLGGAAQSCTFIDNAAAGQGGGVWGSNDVTYAGCAFIGNQASAGGGMFQDDDEPVFIDCVFLQNTSTGNGGGLMTIDTCAPAIIGCRFLGNGAMGAGGGAFHDTSSLPAYVNCVFSANSAVQHGGALRSTGNSVPTVTNCTLSLNHASGLGGGVSVIGPTVLLRNSILWGNTHAGAAGEPAQIHLEGATQIDVDACAIQGLSGGLGGQGNIGDDPELNDPDGPDDLAGTEDDDLTLGPFSAAINAGDNALLPADAFDLDGDFITAEPIPFDQAGSERIVGAVVDMGAYESAGGPTGPGVYVGPDGGSWFVAAHWAGGVVPDGSTHVIIGVAVVIDQRGALAQMVDLLSGGSLVISGGTLTTSLLTIASGCTLHLAHAAATLDVGSLQALAGAAVLWDAGTVALSGTWSMQSAIVMGCAGTATLSLAPGSIVSAPALQVCADGRIEGAGTIAADLTSAGWISPGQSAGTIVVDGAFTQEATGTLAMELDAYRAQAAHDLLDVTGPAQLGGGLEVAVADPSNPIIVAVEIIRAGSIGGSFASVSQPDPPGPFIAGHIQGPAAFLVGATVPGPRLHVNAAAAPGGLGDSWEAALIALDPALTAAALAQGSIQEVWVAAATYVPQVLLDEADPRSATFTLVEGAALYGGFAGDERALEDRDVLANPTILSGDRNGDDQELRNNQENVYHVLSGGPTLTPACALDGFTVRGGNADLNTAFGTTRGAGLSVVGGSPTVRNCRFTFNAANTDGGAIFNGGGAATQIIDCVFEGNASGAGAVGNRDGSSPLVSGCTFQGNVGGLGGACTTRTAPARSSRPAPSWAT